MPAFMEMHPRVSMRRGDEQQPTCPQVRHRRKCTHPRADSQAILAAVRTRSYIAYHCQMLVNHLVPILSGPTLCG